MKCITMIGRALLLAGGLLFVTACQAAQVEAPATRPALPSWTPPAELRDEVNLLAFGDWGSARTRQKQVAKTMAEYAASAARAGRPFSAVLSVGDNLYVKLKGPDDPAFDTLFERMYDPAKLNVPFYMVLGNHDTGSGREAMELTYARENPTSRWKMPSRWYRLEFPKERPIVTVLMLDSNRSTMPRATWKEQLEWMKAELARPRTSRWLIVGAHHTIYSNGRHGDSTRLQEEWADLFEQAGVDLYVCGHDHTLQHLEIPGRRVSYVVSGGGGASRTSMKRSDRGPFGRKLYGFADLRATASALEVRLIDGLTGEVVHEFRRTASDGAVAIVRTTPSDKPSTSSSKAPPSPAATALAALAAGDEDAQMAAALGLEGDELKRFEALARGQAEAFKAWEQGERGQAYLRSVTELAEARAAGDAAAVARATARHATLRQERDAVRRDLRRRLNAALGEEHLRRWAGHVLYREVAQELAGVDLSEEQRVQAYVICRLLAETQAGAADAESDPFLEPAPELEAKALDAVRRLVLRADQRAAD